MGKYEEVLKEERGPRVLRSKGSKVQGSQEPRFLKLRFKYELDSEEGPSCSNYHLSFIKKKRPPF